MQASGSGQPASLNNKFTLWQLLLLLGGLFIFVLLLFAEHSALPTSRATDVARKPVAVQTPTQAALPGGVEGEVIAKLQRELQQEADPSSRKALLGKLVAACINAQLYEPAAGYQAELATLTLQPATRLQAARLYSQAVAQTQDTLSQRQLASRGVKEYAAYNALAPADVDAQVESLLLQMKTASQPQAVMNKVLALRALADAHPENLAATLELGKFSLQTNQFAKAEARFQQAVKLAPANAEAWYLLGLSEAKAGQAVPAKASFKKALTLQPSADLQQAVNQQLSALR